MQEKNIKSLHLKDNRHQLNIKQGRHNQYQDVDDDEEVNKLLAVDTILEAVE